MKALVVRPPAPGAELVEVPRPDLPPGGARVRVLECGVCGTDLDIVGGRYGRAPDGASYLVLGHENLGVVAEVDRGAVGVTPGDLVVATVRRGCGACRFCAAGRSDFCETSRYTERGIWGAHGYLAEEYVELAGELVVVPPSLRSAAVLLEPLSVVEKAIEQGLAVHARERPPPETSGAAPSALVAGTGAIGMLCALALRTRGWKVVAVDRHGSETPAAKTLGRVGARHVDAENGPGVLGPERFDLVVEATGSAELDVSLLDLLAPNGVLVLTGIPDAAAGPTAPLGARLRRLVLQNQAVVGSVNANRTHFALGVADLGRIEQTWPGVAAGLVGERRPWEEYAAVLAQRPAGAIKTALEVGAGAPPNGSAPTSVK